MAGSIRIIISWQGSRNHKFHYCRSWGNCLLDPLINNLDFHDWLTAKLIKKKKSRGCLYTLAVIYGFKTKRTATVRV